MKNKLKAVLLTTDSIPKYGGIADYLHGILSHTVHVIDWFAYSTIGHGDFDDSSLPYSMFRLPDSRRLGKRWGDGFFLTRKLNTLLWQINRGREACDLVNRIRAEHNPDFIVIARWCEESKYWCEACRRSEMSYFIFAYGLELVEEYTPALENQRKCDFNDSRKIISISDCTTKCLAELGISGDKITKLCPGIVPEKLMKLDENEVLNKMQAWGLSGRKFILSLGALVKRKGFDNAIKAFDEIADKYGDLDIVVAGRGDHGSVVKETAENARHSDRVHLLGDVSHQDKQALMQSCEFYIMPNRLIPGDMEGFGIVFLEANMYNKAVIGGNNGGVPDAIEDGVSGLLVDTSGSLQPIIDAMKKLLDDADYASSLGSAGYKRAMDQFTWEKLGAHFYKIVSNLN